MIEVEIKKDHSTVRIHNEFCKSVSQDHIAHINKIVSDSYRRRLLVTGAQLTDGKKPN